MRQHTPINIVHVFKRWIMKKRNKNRLKKAIANDRKEVQSGKT